ncbi:MAG: PTS system trehalose-specific EIIBC component [Longicatena sp.]
MGKYTKDAKELLTYVGGRENISAVSHCVTRMRFVLIDSKKADVKKIEALESAKGTFTQSGQFQVIIGNNVQEFYNEFVAIAHMEGVSKDALKSASKTNQTWLQKLMGNLGEIFAPLIPAIICGGLILGFRNIIDSVKMFEDGTKALVEISQFWAGVDSFLWLIGEAVFHFLPVGIVWSITKKMGTTQILGIILGITLVSPQLLNAYAVAGTALKDIPVWDFGFATVQMIGYQAQVIPAMMAGFVLVYLEKFFRRVSPEYISMIIVPFCSLVPAVLIAHTIVGPIGWTIGNWISTIVYGGLTSTFGWLFATVFGFFYAPLVITGLHHMTNAIDLQLISEFHGTILWPMIALSNIAQGSAVLAMIFLQKKNTKAQQVSIPACISCYLGVTEPALFGVNLKYMFPFVSGMIGSACAATISVGFGVMANSIGVGGIPGILSIQTQHMLTFAIAMAVAIAVPFALTYVIGKKKLTTEQITGIEGEEFFSVSASELEINKTEGFVSPMQGTLLNLEDVEDKAFSSRAMGDGFAIDLKGSQVVAPVSGEVILCFPSKHAYGLRSYDGKEMLLHIGMDSVVLNGEGFTSFVKVGDRVSQGDAIAAVDIPFMKEKGISLVSPVIFTSGEKVKIHHAKETVKIGQKEILSFVE